MVDSWLKTTTTPPVPLKFDNMPHIPDGNHEYLSAHYPHESSVAHPMEQQSASCQTIDVHKTERNSYLSWRETEKAK